MAGFFVVPPSSFRLHPAQCTQHVHALSPAAPAGSLARMTRRFSIAPPAFMGIDRTPTRAARHRIANSGASLTTVIPISAKWPRP